MSFPNYKNKYDKLSFSNAKDLLDYTKKRDPKFADFRPPKGFIIAFDDRIINIARKHHKLKKVKFYYGDTYIINNTVGIISKFGIGAPVTISLLEKFIAHGTKKFIAIGASATLQKKIKIGDIVVCNRAIRDEGTSYHYIKPSKYAYANEKILSKITSYFDKNKQHYILGTSWSTDGLYRETVDEVKHYTKEGVATLEMEASALFGASKYLDVQTASIFIISDTLAETKWKPQYHAEKFEKNLENTYLMSYNVLSQNYN